ncbi:MAG TPA: Crp/Fnr family transcriptional regulator [Allosphingosinicella sp.]|jgi:CRP-like cAMP-binding protein
MAPDDESLGWLTRKLEALVPLGDEDRAAIGALPTTIRSVPAAHVLVREGRETSECCVLVEGYACRHKLAAGGGRQIVSFQIRGDILDLQHLLLPVADHNVQTITEATVAWIPKSALMAVARRRTAVAEALWKDSLIDASIFREWVLNVGRRDAKARIAHMLCEFVARCEAAGLGSPDRFELPMTQEQIADATGLTAVHVNRMLRALVDEGVVARGRRELRITDWPRLRSIAGFNSTYLHAAA